MPPLKARLAEPTAPSTFIADRRGLRCLFSVANTTLAGTEMLYIALDIRYDPSLSLFRDNPVAGTSHEFAPCRSARWNYRIRRHRATADGTLIPAPHNHSVPLP